MKLCPHCGLPLEPMGTWGIHCHPCHYAEAIGGEIGDIPLNRPTGPAEDDVREKRLQAHEEGRVVKVDLFKLWPKIKKWFGKA